MNTEIWIWLAATLLCFFVGGRFWRWWRETRLEERQVRLEESFERHRFQQRDRL